MGCHGSTFSSTTATYAITFMAHHRWLVPMWCADLQFRFSLAQRLGVASGIVAQVAVRHFRDAPRIVKSCTYINDRMQTTLRLGSRWLNLLCAQKEKRLRLWTSIRLYFSVMQTTAGAGGVRWVDCRKHQFHLC